jgi:GTP-binding protein
MMFSVNNSPLAGRDGKQLTSRQIKERLDRELISNVSLRMEPGSTGDAYMVYGRGELQLAILIEQMRREGFELTLSRPEVVKKEEEGVLLEPFEELTIEVRDEHVGVVTQALAARKGTIEDMQSAGGRTRMRYRVPSRGLIGFRGEILTETRGEAVMNTLFAGWFEDVGELPRRTRGTLVADRTGRTTAYALFKLQPRGELFVPPGVEVYEGMVVGLHTRENDLNVDCTKGKQLTNIRTTAADEKLILAPPKVLSLEEALEFIDEDERVEVTPTAIRLRKEVLSTSQRSVIRGGVKK